MASNDFTGFPAETFAFLSDLAAHNQKAWFDAHRAEYQAHVVDPAMAFIVAMGGPLAAIDARYQAVPRLNGSFRRINRDVRFSRDKTPYSPRIHLVFWTGEHPNRSPAIHLVLHPDGFGFGAGAWAWPPDTLAAFRDRLDAPAALADLRAAIASAETTGATLTAPSLKRVPKGRDAGHPAADLLKHKGLIVRTADRLPLPGTVNTPGFVDHCAGLCAALHPVNLWLIDKLN
ncbi:DUF2461 domain-containing protein [Oceanibium sediminis]|uniref:DUF2461 domain-containing protein n=1 Tax=Oceanibium sediminis TaxID=2026339 RepID=UPI000DD329B1|nr:DUF2461 domain-containing protein [Oceanibium sediminis]